METTIQKWGNSLAVRLPREVTKRMAMQEGSAVEVREGTAGIVIRHAPQAGVSLKELVAMIRHGHTHTETVWGGMRGQEVW